MSIIPPPGTTLDPPDAPDPDLADLDLDLPDDDHDDPGAGDEPTTVVDITDGADEPAAEAEETHEKEPMSPTTGIMVLLAVAYVVGAIAGFFLYGHPRIITCLAFGFIGMGAVGLIIALVALVRAGVEAVSEAI